ncbi:hypothetical protein ABE484_17390 [Pseudomonas pudica]|uniref:hypothetical protein n=1 Tax=Pseudomonas TaxID=286 RepID=UPI000A1F7354|nr:hypothetical protein [Pseudomonas sp. B10(2017)]
MTHTKNPAPNTNFGIVYSLVWYGLLNDCWKAYHAKNEFVPGEALLLDRQTDAETWKVASAVFGQPLVKWSDGGLELHKRLLSEREVVLKLEPGSREAWLREIRDVGYDGSQVLTIKASIVSSLAYRGEGVVRLEWSAEPEFSFTGQDTLLLKLTRGYQAKKGIDLYSVGTPTNSQLRELIVSFQPFNQGTAMGINYNGTNLAVVEVQSPAFGSLPDRAGTAAMDQIIFLFAQRAFPEVSLGKAPYDEAWVPSLVFPPPHLKRKSGSYDESLEVYGTEYNSPKEAFLAAEGAQLQKTPLSLDPLVRLIANGTGKQEVILQPGPDSATWVLEGERLGRVEQEHDTRYYYPPGRLQPDVVLESDNKTDRPAAVISSVPEKFTVDVVKATQGGESAYSTFAMYYAPMTHYFKMSLEGGKLKLTLWYYSSKIRQEVQIEGADIKWAIAAGNGKVSSTGVFSPADSDPSPFTVVWAQDTTNDFLLYWAFTIIPIPLYSPAEAVALFQN